VTAVPLSLAELLPSWQIALKAKNRSSNTLEQYSDGIRLFVRWWDSTGAPDAAATDQLTKVNVQAFMSHLFANGAQATTVRARYIALKQFSAWLVKEGETAADALVGLTPPTVDVKITDPLTEAELRDLISVCQGKTFRDGRDEAIVRLMAETGMRAGECMSLSVADVDTLHGRARVVRGKGGKGRVVPFGPHTAAAVDRYIRARRTHKLAGMQQLWLGDRSKTFSYTSLWRTLTDRGSRPRGYLRLTLQPVWHRLGIGRSHPPAGGVTEPPPGFKPPIT
jgi:integrase/recombinase XerD